MAFSGSANVCSTLAILKRLSFSPRVSTKAIITTVFRLRPFIDSKWNKMHAQPEIMCFPFANEGIEPLYLLIRGIRGSF